MRALGNIYGTETRGIAAAVSSARLGARARAKESVSDRLRTSALNLFAERGYDAVTVADISEMAGVTPRTFFRHFPSKETVVVDIFDHSNTRLTERLTAHRPDAHVLQTLGEVLEAWLTEFSEVFDLISRLSGDSPALQGAMLLRQATWQEHLTDAIAARYPEFSKEESIMWGTLAYAFTEIADKLASERSVSRAEALHEAINLFRGASR